MTKEPPAPSTARIKLRLEYPHPLVLGPGKADLLERIDRLGSISAAGRDMGMSYKRAWSLVEEMNTAFAAPVVDSSRGGQGGGGATLTPQGKALLSHYRALEQVLHISGADHLAALQAMLRTPTEADQTGG